MLSKAQVSPLWMRSLLAAQQSCGYHSKKEKMGCDGWTLNRVTFCHWYRSCASDEMGMPEGKDGKDCTSRRYWGADVDIATGTNNLLS